MVTKCPNCGSDVPPQARFCPSCGTPILPSVASTDPSHADEGYARFYADDPHKPAPPPAPTSTPTPLTPQPEAPRVEPVAAPAAPAWTPPPAASAPPPPTPHQATPHQAAAAPIAPTPPVAAAPVAAAPVTAAPPPVYAGGGHDGAGNGGNGGGGDYGDIADDERPSRGLWPWLAGGAFLVAAGIFAYGYMQDGRDLTPITDTGTSGGETANAAPATVINPRVTLFVAADANVRDKPTTAGSKVVSKVKRGSEVKGDVVAGSKGDQWLKLEGQEAYVSMINLMKDAPATLVSTSASDATIKTQCRVLARPEAGAAVKVTLAPGAKVKITGLTENGYAEFALPRGGAGYVESEGKSCLSGGEALAIRFDPGACNFGPEIEGFIRKIPPTDGESEDSQSYVTVNRSYRGVPVNSAFVGWEVTGLTFDGSIAEVRAAFLADGYKLDADNNFIPPEGSEGEAGASLDPRNPSDKRGRTELSCGL